MEEHATRQTFPLLDLPLELRNEIYNHTLRNGTTAILRTSKQVYIEASQFIFRSGVFRFFISEKVTRANPGPQSQMKTFETDRVQNIAITIEVSESCRWHRRLEKWFPQPFLALRSAHLSVCEIHLSASEWRSMTVMTKIVNAISRIECETLFLSHPEFLLNAFNKELLQDSLGPARIHRTGRSMMNGVGLPCRLYGGWDGASFTAGEELGDEYVEFHPNAYRRSRVWDKP